MLKKGRKEFTVNEMKTKFEAVRGIVDDDPSHKPMIPDGYFEDELSHYDRSDLIR